jgi:nucleotide-binding universal stress UspA family protein
MRETYSPPPSVVVGIDGSRAAVRAALWAVDEAVSRDIPLRLVCAIDTCETADTDPQDEARKLAAAEIAVRYALRAVESTEKPVKIEVEIVEGRPTRALTDASRSAAMICIGSLGLKHFTRGRVGSTAAALAASAHCPVAVIRGNDGGSASEPGWVVIEVDETPDSVAALRHAMEEARLRHAPLRVLTTWQSRFTDVHDIRAAADGNRLVRAKLDRSLAYWRRHYLDLDVRSVAVHGSVLNHLAKHGESIQLAVVGARGSGGGGELVGPTGYAALHNTDCSVLICDRRPSL